MDRPRSLPSRFAIDRRGFTGAEKALMIAFGLAVLIWVGALLRGGSQRAGGDAQTTLSQGLSGNGGGLGQVLQQAPQAVVAPEAKLAGSSPWQRIGAGLRTAWRALPSWPRAPDPNLFRYPDGSSVQVVRDPNNGLVTGLIQQDAAGRTVAWKTDALGEWRVGPTLDQANRPVGRFTFRVGPDRSLTTESDTEVFTRFADGTTTIVNRSTGIERRVSPDGTTITISRTGTDPLFRLTPGADGEIGRIVAVRRNETWTRTATGWKSDLGDVRSEVQITGTKIVWTGALKDGKRTIYVEDLRNGARSNFTLAERDYAFLKDKHQEFLRLGILPPHATVADADTLYSAAEQAKLNLALRGLYARQRVLTALSIGRKKDPTSARQYSTHLETLMKFRQQMIDQRLYLSLSASQLPNFSYLDKKIDYYKDEKPTTGELAGAAGQAVLLKVGDIFDGVVDHPFRTAGLVVATIVAPEVTIPVLVGIGGFSAGYQIGIGAQTVYSGYQTNNHAQIYQGVSQLSAGTIDLALTVAAAKAPVGKGGTATQTAELETALARNLNVSAQGLTRQTLIDGLARRFPAARAGEGVSLEEQVLQHAADQLARMKGWDPVIVRLKSAPDLSPLPGPPRAAGELAKSLGLPENATQAEALASLFRRFPRLRGSEALELTQKEAAALRDLAELARLKNWKTELVLKVEEGAVPPPGQDLLPAGTRPALPPPQSPSSSSSYGTALAKLGQQADAAADALARQKLDFLAREAAKDIGEGLKNEFVEGVLQRAADPKNAGRQISELLKEEIAANPGKYVLKGDAVPLAELEQQGAFSRVIGLETVFSRNLTAAAKEQFAKQGITTPQAFAEAVAKDPAIFDAATMLDKNSLVSGANGVAWWSPKGASTAKTLPELVDELALNPSYYKGGAIRVTVDPAAASKLGFRKPTTFDGVNFKEWVEAPPGSPLGRTAGGKPEAVAPGVPLGKTTQIEFFK